MPPIAGHNILIIGGSSGIGAAIAKLAAAEGANIFIASSNESRVNAAVEKIAAALPGARIRGFTCDVKGDDAEERLTQLLAEVTTAAGEQLDHIINTAAVFDFKPLSAYSIDFLRASVQFTYIVPLLIAKTAPKFINKKVTSSILFTGGRVGEKPIKGGAFACGVAAGLYGLTRALALELAPLRVNLVSPGVTDTEMQGEGPQREQRMAAAAESSLLGKVGSPEEVAEAYMYLMKDSNNTGSCVSTSGGILLQ